MTDSVKPKNHFSPKDSIPSSAVPLEAILCTEELHRRPSRPPDYEKENRALAKLVTALADSPSTVLQTLAETILDITRCDSAGLSLLTRDGKTPDVKGHRFFWPAMDTLQMQRYDLGRRIREVVRCEESYCLRRGFIFRIELVFFIK